MQLQVQRGLQDLFHPHPHFAAIAVRPRSAKKQKAYHCAYAASTAFPATVTGSQSLLTPSPEVEPNRLQGAHLPPLITHEEIRQLEAELDSGPSVAALRRFNGNLGKLDAQEWERKLKPVMHELAYNLESFNPAFTSVLLKVQSSIGWSDYARRDMALKNLIQPLAGEYGMHNGELQAKTHRELFSEFYQDLMGVALEDVLTESPRPPLSVGFFGKMMRDLSNCGGREDPVEQASYALGYNLAIEYLADYEKTWMLDSFRALNASTLAPQGRGLSQWLFLEVHAEGEAEHAAIGHNAVSGFVPSAHVPVLRQAMRDHDHDFSKFYNALADMLE